MFFPLFPTQQTNSGSLVTPTTQPHDHELNGTAKHLQKPLNTLGLIWRKNEPKKTSDGFIITSITANTPETCLDELRANDYFILKKGLVSPSTRSRLENIVHVNMQRRDKGLKPSPFEKSIESQLWETASPTHSTNLLPAKPPTNLFTQSSSAFSTNSTVFKESQPPTKRFSSLISDVSALNDSLPLKSTSSNLPNEKQSLFRSLFDNSALEALANNNQNILKATANKQTTSFPHQGNLFSSTPSKAFPQLSPYVLSKDADYQELFSKTTWPANNKQSYPTHNLNISTSQLDNFLIKESSNPSNHIANFQKILHNDSNFFKLHTTPESQVFSVPKPENSSSIPKPEQQRTYYSFLPESENAQHPPTENLLPSLKAISPFTISQNPYLSSTNLNQNEDLPYSFFPSPLNARNHPIQEKERDDNINALQASHEKPRDQADSIKEKSLPQVGSYSSELNKMVMIGSFMELLKDHGASFPKDVLDTTDFVPKMFEFLKSYNVEMPTLQTPKYRFKKDKESSASTVLHVTKEKPNQIDKKPAKVESKEGDDPRLELTLKEVSEDLSSMRLLSEKQVGDLVENLSDSREVQSQETERKSQGSQNLKVQEFEEVSSDRSSTSSTEMVTFSVEIIN